MRHAMILAMAVLCAVALTTTVNAEILQPGPEGKDATVMYNPSKLVRADWNLGAKDVMYVNASGSLRRHSFIEFDVSGISTASGDIASVKLSLLDYYWANLGGAPGGDREIGLYQVTEPTWGDWDEGPGVWNYTGVGNEVTYNKQPPFNSTPVATIMMPAQLTEAEALAGGVWHVWDSNGPGNSGLLDLVKGWADESIANYGLAVRLTAPDDSTDNPAHYYRTSDHTVSSERPMLEITPVPEPGCVVLLLCGMASLLLIARRRR